MSETKREITININGRPRTIEQRRYTFNEIVMLAFTDAVFNDQTTYTITYSRAKGEKHTGTLAPGDSIEVTDGMVFNVARTDKS